MMFSSPVLLEDDHFFSMSQGQHHFLLGHEISDHDQLALLDNHDFVDVMMVAGNFEMERVAPDLKKQTKAIGRSSIDDCKPVKRTRAGKKDRHSKIYTAQGPRDRRMRLSLEIARKFFDLQDKLGFDKASNTIEWLFNMSKTAIKEVMGSRMDEPHGDQFGGNDNISCEDGRKDKLKKDVRDKARARARERTLEKMRLGALKKDPTQGLFLTLEKAAAAANNPSNHSCLEQIEHEDPGAIAQSVEDLIHTDWEIYNGTFFSSYDFDDTTLELQHVLTTGINHVLI